MSASQQLVESLIDVSSSASTIGISYSVQWVAPGQAKQVTSNVISFLRCQFPTHSFNFLINLRTHFANAAPSSRCTFSSRVIHFTRPIATDGSIFSTH